ncbi:hypothetical protein Pmani_017986 [Petrolisthes manimaculis]|uniref:Uncharacterized protein n=1 Tax=Petrolisthes manimaculis TaxID=1843537 RepID=A0AAE1U5A2_9EUCA|nr:hypothetical protein Pmani_017986 [Petrolisthes manimaculis]
MRRVVRTREGTALLWADPALGTELASSSSSDQSSSPVLSHKPAPKVSNPGSMEDMSRTMSDMLSSLVPTLFPQLLMSQVPIPAPTSHGASALLSPTLSLELPVSYQLDVLLLLATVAEGSAAIATYDLQGLARTFVEARITARQAAAKATMELAQRGVVKALCFV